MKFLTETKTKYKVQATDSIEQRVQDVAHSISAYLIAPTYEAEKKQLLIFSTDKSIETFFGTKYDNYMSPSNIYDYIVARMGRGGSSKEAEESEWKQLQPPLANLRKTMNSQPINNIEMNDDGPWLHFIINGDVEKESKQGGTHKSYATIRLDSLKDLEKAVIEGLKAVQKSGFKGQIKLPKFAKTLVETQDSLVVHAPESQKALTIFMKEAERHGLKFGGRKGQVAEEGLDVYGTSFSMFMGAAARHFMKTSLIPSFEKKADITYTDIRKNILTHFKGSFVEWVIKLLKMYKRGDAIPDWIPKRNN